MVGRLSSWIRERLLRRRITVRRVVRWRCLCGQEGEVLVPVGYKAHWPEEVVDTWLDCPACKPAEWPARTLEMVRPCV